MVARIRGVHLDCTEAQLEEKMRGFLDEGRRESGPGWSCRVALEKNALGLCETGNALVALERGGDGEGSGSPDEVATWLGDRMEAAAETEGFFRGLECSGAVDEEVFAGLVSVSQGRVEGDLLGGANLDQHRKALEEMEEEFRVFENNSY